MTSRSPHPTPPRLAEAVIGRLIGVGFAIVLLVAFGMVRLLASSLHGIDVMDPLAPGMGMVVLGSAAVIATLVPAWRASKVDPVGALRKE